MPLRHTFALAAKYSLLLLALACPVRANQVIANWDVVPGQVIDQPFKVGVVAFHENDVSVDFFVNGAPVASVDEPSWNDRTGVWEYWFTLDPANYDDGPLTLTAAASPDGTGENRNLADLTLYANANGTLTNATVVWVDWENGNDGNSGTELSPKKNIMAGINAAGDGGTVYLKASQDYELFSDGGNFTYWTTVSAAPGLTAEDVHILTYGGSGTGRYSKNGILWQGVSLFCDRSSTSYGNVFYINNGQRMWFDECVIYDANGRWANTTVFNNQGGKAYFTNTHVRDVANITNGWQRNCLYERVGADVFRGGSNLLAVNVTIRVMDKGSTGAHPDFIQFYNPGSTAENAILYNIKCFDMFAQGFFGVGGSNAAAEDVAFVNIILEKVSGGSFRSQLTGTWQHALLWNVTMINQVFDFRTSTNINEFFVKNCHFGTFTSDNASHPSIYIDYAHTSALNWNQSAPLGNNITFGSSVYIDSANADYRLDSTDPGYATGELPPGVWADADGFPYDPSTPNRGVFSQANPGANKRKASHSVDQFQTTPAGSDTELATVLIADEATERYKIYVGDDLVNWTYYGTRYADSDGKIYVDERLNSFNGRRFYRLERIFFPDLSESPTN